MKLVEIVFDLPLDRTFDYLAGRWAGQLQPGCRVRVPFGPRSAIGWVVGEKEVEKAVYRYRTISRLYDRQSLLTSELLELCRYLAWRYCASLGQVLATITAGFSLTYPAGKKSSPERKDNQPSPENNLFSTTAVPAGETTFFLYGKQHQRNQYLLSLASASSGSCLFLFPETRAASCFHHFLAGYFPDRTVFFHGELPGSLRLKLWHRLMTEKNLFLVGTRLGVFAPLTDLSLICLDEPEHPGYQERRQPRYETTEIASWRARKLGAGLVLTEGCLSLSHYHAISSGQARLSVASQVLLRARVRVIPWQRASRRQLLTFLTEEAIACLEETVLKGQRLAILHHRKGSFRLISCKNCDHCFPCPDCALPMVPLEKTKSLACRFCGQNFPLPEKCPACGSKKIIWRGTGLHNILQSLKKAYPHLEIATVTAEEKMPSNPSAQIFLGTLALEEIMEEIAPALLLIPAADAFLNLPDYRSEERFFCLVNRCRQKMPPEATVLLQTYNPGLPLFQSLVANNDQLFYEKELQLRRQLAYPPFTTLLKIEIETRPEKKLDKQRRVLEELFSRCQMEPVYNGPGYPPVIRKHYRWKYLFKLASLENLKRLRPASEMPEVSLTFNPVEM